MRARGVEPNAYTYTAAITACEAGGKWGAAVELLRAMEAQGVPPDVFTYSAAIKVRS